MTVRDLSPFFLQASERAAAWSEGYVHGTLRLVSELVPDTRVDWEPGDEGMGCVLGVGEVVACVWADGPLVILVGRHASIAEELKDEGLVVAGVSDYEAAECSFDPSVTERVFPGMSWQGLGVDPHSFSFNDLYWCLA
jgi:hypothetical protein